MVTAANIIAEAAGGATARRDQAPLNPDTLPDSDKGITTKCTWPKCPPVAFEGEGSR